MEVHPMEKCRNLEPGKTFWNGITLDQRSFNFFISKASIMSSNGHKAFRLCENILVHKRMIGETEINPFAVAIDFWAG